MPRFFPVRANNHADQRDFQDFAVSLRFLQPLRLPWTYPIVNGQPQAIRRTRQTETERRPKNNPQNIFFYAGKPCQLRKKKRGDKNRQENRCRQGIIQIHGACVIAGFRIERKPANRAFVADLKKTGEQPAVSTVWTAKTQPALQRLRKGWPFHGYNPRNSPELTSEISFPFIITRRRRGVRRGFSSLWAPRASGLRSFDSSAAIGVSRFFCDLPRLLGETVLVKFGVFGFRLLKDG